MKEVKSKHTVNDRLKKGVLFYKTVDDGGTIVNVPWRRYYFCVSLNHGLSQTADCLPADTLVSIKLHRAPSNFAFIKLSDSLTVKVQEDGSNHNFISTYPEAVVPVINPVLAAYYAYSSEMEKIMSRVNTSSIEIPFLDYVTRRTILDAGLGNFDVNLLHGKLPKYIIFALSSMNRINGSEKLSLTKFGQGDLETFDMLIGELLILFILYNFTD